MKAFKTIALLAIAGILTAAGFTASAQDNTPDASAPHGKTELILAGGQYVRMLRPDNITGDDYHTAVFWEWNAEDHLKTMGIEGYVYDHIDDCKISDDRTKILISCSGGWVAVYSLERDRIIFFTREVKNVHSAEFLPGNKLAVACSTGGDAIKLFDLKYSNIEKFTTPLTSAHGVVWNEKHQRLYAIGGQLLRIYRLVNATTQNPRLELETEIKAPKKSLHDLSPVDENTLCVSGRNSYLFNLDTHEFTELTQFNGRTGLKSVNYNPVTNEAWYTDATNAEGSYSWSTQTVHHTADPMGTADHCTFKTPDVNLYKVRVISWGDGNGALGGIESAIAGTTDSTAPVEYFDLQGRKVANPANGIYIMKQGSQVSKQVFR